MRLTIEENDKSSFNTVGLPGASAPVDPTAQPSSGASIMSFDHTAQRDSRRSTAVRARMAALCAAWTAHTLKRAIADVATMSAQDYRAFGLDKGEILAGLRQLRDEIEHAGPAPAAAAAGNSDREPAHGRPLETGKGWPMMIAVVKRRVALRLHGRSSVSQRLCQAHALE